MTALAAAAVTVGARLAPHVALWTLIGQFTHGRLVTLANTGVTITLPQSPHTPATGRHRHPRHHAPGRHRADQAATAPTEMPESRLHHQ